MPELRICTKCSIPKELEEFRSSKKGSLGLAAECRSCERAYQIARSRKYPDYQRHNRFRRLYQLTPEQIAQKLKEQNNCCALCLISGQKLHIDHNHETGTVRGLICFACNAALGLCKDSLSWLYSAIQYLEIERPQLTTLQLTIRAIGQSHRSRESRLNSFYGLTESCVRDMVIAQARICAICLLPLNGDWNVDHDHETGAIRGVLHRGCNTGLGHFKDNINILKCAVLYLQRSWPQLTLYNLAT